MAGAQKTAERYTADSAEDRIRAEFVFVVGLWVNEWAGFKGGAGNGRCDSRVSNVDHRQ